MPEWLMFSSGKSKAKETQAASRWTRRRLLTPGMVGDKKKCLWNQPNPVQSRCLLKDEHQRKLQGPEAGGRAPQRRPLMTRAGKHWVFLSARLSGALPGGGPAPLIGPEFSQPDPQPSEEQEPGWTKFHATRPSGTVQGKTMTPVFIDVPKI